MPLVFRGSGGEPSFLARCRRQSARISLEADAAKDFRAQIEPGAGRVGEHPSCLFTRQPESTRLYNPVLSVKKHDAADAIRVCRRQEIAPCESDNLPTLHELDVISGTSDLSNGECECDQDEEANRGQNSRRNP
jgi:hypothetical protein